MLKGLARTNTSGNVQIASAGEPFSLKMPETPHQCLCFAVENTSILLQILIQKRQNFPVRFHVVFLL